MCQHRANLKGAARQASQQKKGGDREHICEDSGVIVSDATDKGEGTRGTRVVLPLPNSELAGCCDLGRLLCARLPTDLLGCGVRASTASAAVLFSSCAEQLRKRFPRSLHAGVVGVEVESVVRRAGLGRDPGEHWSAVDRLVG